MKDKKGKDCCVCKQYKTLDCFNRNKTSKDGHDNRCRDCVKEYRQTPEYKEKNRERNKENYKDPVKRAKQIERVQLQRMKPISEEEKERRKERDKRNLSLWKQKNPEKVKEASRKNSLKWRSDPKNKLSSVISANIRHRLDRGVKGSRDWESLVGYTIEELKVHLESLWEEGMTWENHTLNGWHIDHVIPVKNFNFEKPEDPDFKECWSLKNLIPRWSTTDIARMHGSTRIGNQNKSCKIIDE